MTRKLEIPQETLVKQALAANPGLSAWVSAHAGSGKTHVLSQRVVRLLLDGCEPSKVLCLTYTRAAAANMANRVFKDLAKWALMADAELGTAIEELTGQSPDADTIANARKLFARALETPGGLKIQTIHAFCEAILQQFPLEANIAGHFELLDNQQEAALIAEARRDMITGAAGDNLELAEAFADVLQRVGEFGLDALLAEIVRKRDGLRSFIDQIAGGASGLLALRDEFGFDAGETEETIAGSVWPLPGFGDAYFSSFVTAAQDVDAGLVLNNILPDAYQAFGMDGPATQRLTLLADGFLKADGDAYGEKTFKKALRDRLPDLLDRYGEAAAAIIDAKERLALFRMVEATRSALTIADWLIARYERLKSARGFLDFNDLIKRTVRLLARDEAGAWVQYKLDQGIDHILIDEAQDTSPDQWEVVKKLAAEFFAGRGARDNVHRTIFAVGDEKQSIYSFQGARPEAFEETRQEFSERVVGANGNFERVRLTRSFRSTDDVLKAVDLVFAEENSRKGLTRDPEQIAHDGVRTGQPGYVELWSSLGPIDVEEPDDWTVPVDHASAPAARLANTIADTIHGWIDKGEILEGQGHKVTPGDILILVRKRGSFVHALTRALKDSKRNVPVAGADRLALTGHIAVKDLLSIGRVVQQPHDDLSLAALLRSPIFDFSEDDLFAVANGRKTSLYAALQATAAKGGVFAEAAAALGDWRNRAAFMPVFEFYAGILAGEPARQGARALLIARLGAEAGDVIDEFLSFCLAIEQTGSKGLEALLATLDEAAPEIKREMDQGRNEVRIMTVHASKGLEAPIVFLVDPGGEPFHSQHLPALMPFASATKAWSGDGYLWRAGSETTNAFSKGRGDRIKEAAEDEYRRLLYVGMTRAKDRLIVCGYHGKKGRSASTWHAMVEAGLSGAEHAEALNEPANCAPVLRFRTTPPEAVSADEMQESAAQPPPLLPDDLRAPVAHVAEPPRALRPSAAGYTVDDRFELPVPATSPVFGPDAGSSMTLARGTAIHRLLQMLPEIAADEWSDAAQRYLELAGADWPQAERDRAATSVLDVLGDPAFGAVFALGSRAEISVMGTLKAGGREWAVSGKIDRLAVSDSEVLIVDYKTGRSVPRTVADAPEHYVAQLAIYRALLQPVYPGKIVSAALLFTEAPFLLPMPVHALEAALERLTTP